MHVLGFGTFLGWMVAGQGWEAALTAAIAVLIITCPCALALAVPAVQVAATSRLFGRGVLVKAPDGLERLAEADTVVFDKTGTLSLGEPRLLEGGSDDTLARAAALASASRHPYAGLARRTPEGEERLGSARWCGVAEASDAAATLWYRPASGAAVDCCAM